MCRLRAILRRFWCLSLEIDTEINPGLGIRIPELRIFSREASISLSPRLYFLKIYPVRIRPAEIEVEAHKYLL